MYKIKWKAETTD